MNIFWGQYLEIKENRKKIQSLLSLLRLRVQNSISHDNKTKNY